VRLYGITHCSAKAVAAKAKLVIAGSPAGNLAELDDTLPVPPARPDRGRASWLGNRVLGCEVLCFALVFIGRSSDGLAPLALARGSHSHRGWELVLGGILVDVHERVLVFGWGEV
jgi:hypothetical protein